MIFIYHAHEHCAASRCFGRNDIMKPRVHGVLGADDCGQVLMCELLFGVADVYLAVLDVYALRLCMPSR